MPELQGGLPNLAFPNAFQDHLVDGSHFLTHNFDANGKLILNPAGIGGALGKAIKIVATAADIKTACEDAAIYEVWILPGTYVYNAAITPTSNKLILGLGLVTFDWNGAVDGQLFNHSVATSNNIYENLAFAKSGNAYYGFFVTSAGASSSKIRMSRITTVAGVTIQVGSYVGTGSDFQVYDSSFAGALYCVNPNTVIENSRISGELRILFLARGIKLNGLYFTGAGYIYFDMRTTYPSIKDFTAIDCKWIGSTATRCVYFSSAATPYNLQGAKFLGCLFQPQNNTRHCIEVLNHAS